MAGECDTANQDDTRLHYMREALKMVRDSSSQFGFVRETC